MELKEMYVKKKAFVENELAALLLKLDCEVESVRYDSENSKESIPYREYVIVTYISGFDRKVEVTGDSHKGIVSDVIKRV